MITPFGRQAMREFQQIDVFTRHAGDGNPLAVVLDAHGLDDAAMQRFAAWTNLSETTFLLPPTQPGADYRVRIFSPRTEMPFAGHPSVGTAWAALHSGRITPRDGRLVQECGAGLLPLIVEGEAGAWRIHVRAPRAVIADPTASEWHWLADALDRSLLASPDAIRRIDNGPVWWVAHLRAADEVRRLSPRLREIAHMCTKTDAAGLAVFARTDADDTAVVTRAFCPADGIDEDPVTGSANAAIGAWLYAQGQLAGTQGYRASQGREVGRDGVVHVRPDAAGDIWIGGDCVGVISGQLRW
ncbi:PhzF family phenazine biosynthesis protein [Tahibacter amnicola]|uniref:PhzF family phenazine biosynthesis protein n=1 Tax=Tahibacter amnicola TaxID=2976241 RepID=A0ABY6BB48_9GAMM|nr:PhzF family phenazine biosynthesis protein [Tahibacter amnicola]UXI67281.1 PhzF family phenazine biosynthesis protein [Tahibacter amnicola]